MAARSLDISGVTAQDEARLFVGDSSTTNDHSAVISGTGNSVTINNNWQSLSDILREMQLPVHADAKVRDAPPVLHEPDKSLPHYLIPFPRNKRFTGRESVLADLERFVFEDPTCQSVCLVGLGGVGKTQIAVEFIHQIKERHMDYSVFWIPAQSEEAFNNAYLSFAKRFGIVQRSKEDDIRERVKRFIDDDTERRWLFVLDNADDEDILFTDEELPTGIVEYIPELREGRVMLMTSRHTQAATSIDCDQIINVKTMTNEEAVEMLRNSLRRQDHTIESSLLKELVEELTCLPLAISQAAAYLNAKGIALKDYLHQIRNTDEDRRFLLRKSFRAQARQDKSNNAVLSTWITSFLQIARIEPDAAELLLLMSLVESKAIPYEMLPQLEPEARMRDAIATLTTYAFVTVDNGMIDMHRLVHMAANDWARSSDREGPLRTKLIERMSENLPETSDTTINSLWQYRLPHAIHILQTIPDDTVDGYQIDLIWKVILELYRQDRMKDHLTWASKWCDLEERIQPPRPVSRLKAQYRYIFALYTSGQSEEAVLSAERTIALNPQEASSQQQVLHEFMGIKGFLGSLYISVGRIHEACDILQEVITVYKQSTPPDPLVFTTDLSNLTEVYNKLGRLDDASRLQKEVLESKGIWLANDIPRPRRIRIMVQLARIQVDAQDQAKATELLQDAVREASSLAPDDPERWEFEHAAGWTYCNMGQYDTALELLESVARQREAANSPRNLDTFRAKMDIGRIYINMKRHDDAERVLTSAMAAYEASSLDDIWLRYSLELLAYSYLSCKRFDDVRRLLEPVIYTHGSNDDSATVRNPAQGLALQAYLASAYCGQGQVQRAIALQGEVVATTQRVLGPSSRQSINRQHRLATFYSEADEHEKAFAVSTSLRENAEKGLPPGDKDRTDAEELFAVLEKRYNHYVKGDGSTEPGSDVAASDQTVCQSVAGAEVDEEVKDSGVEGEVRISEKESAKSSDNDNVDTAADEKT